MDERRVPRWERAPGWDALLDRLDAYVRAHPTQSGHEPVYGIKSKAGISPAGVSFCCPAMEAELEEVDRLSWGTCELCGAQPAEERLSHPWRIYAIATPRRAQGRPDPSKRVLLGFEPGRPGPPRQVSVTAES